MTEMYATYLVWDGCSAPGNLECNGRLCGQRVRAVPFDRDALLRLARYMDKDVAETEAHFSNVISTKSVSDYARRIREACGEVEHAEA